MKTAAGINARLRRLETQLLKGQPHVPYSPNWIEYWDKLYDSITFYGIGGKISLDYYRFRLQRDRTLWDQASEEERVVITAEREDYTRRMDAAIIARDPSRAPDPYDL